MLFASSLFFTVISSWMLTGAIRHYALRKNLLDVPNKRSSHTVPVPRGGGLAINITFLIGIMFAYFTGKMDFNILSGLLGAGVLVGVVGFLDDHRHIPPRWRLLAHFMAAAWALAWVGGIQGLTVFGGIVMSVWAGYFVGAVCLVWLLNLFNFMDGIDGIASVETIYVAFSGFLFAHHAGHVGMSLVAIILIGAVLGFLIWNWPPAKIFMGDVGSGFLGIVLGVYACWAMIEDVVDFWTWLIIFGVFLVDATFTLLRRILRKAVWYEAHRTHAYQHAAQRWGHVKVTICVTLINIIWLLPIAYFSNTHRSWGPGFVLLALTPLIVLVFLLRAGKEID